MTIKTNIFIKAPIEKVFDAFSDIEKITDRIDNIKRVEILNQPKFGVGTKWRETREMFGKEATEEMWVTDVQKNKSYTVAAESNGTKYETIYTFESKDDGTYVEMSFTGSPISFGAKLLSPMFILFKGATEKELKKDMIALKKFCEK